MAWLLPKKKPESENNFEPADTPKAFASRRLPLQGNRNRKGASLIKTMRLF